MNFSVKKVDKKRSMLYLALFSVMIFLITYFIVYKEAFMPGTDYHTHEYWAVNFTIDLSLLKLLVFRNGAMWEILCKIGSVFMPLEMSSAVLTALFNVATYYIVRRLIGDDFLGSLMSFLLMIVGPLYVPIFNPTYYIGQGTPNIWHNPTNISVRPFTVIIFVLVLYIITLLENDKIKPGLFWLLTGLLLISEIAKASFLQAIIPALGIYLVIFCIKTKFKHIKNCILLVLTFVPAVAFMFFQTLAYFYIGEDAAVTGGFGVSWMLVLDTMTPNAYFSFLLVMLFPLVYLGFNFKRMIVKTDIQLAILMIITSWLLQAIFYEVNRPHDGNFTWAYLLALFIIWFEVTRYLYEDICSLIKSRRGEAADYPVKTWVLVLESVIYFVHLVCGAGYVVCLLMLEGYWI